jgi:hypothetical protein
MGVGGLSNTPGGWGTGHSIAMSDLFLKRACALVAQIILLECTHAVEPAWNLLPSLFRTAE